MAEAPLACPWARHCVGVPVSRASGVSVGTGCVLDTTPGARHQPLPSLACHQTKAPRHCPCLAGPLGPPFSGSRGVCIRAVLCPATPEGLNTRVPPFKQHLPGCWGRRLFVLTP